MEAVEETLRWRWDMLGVLNVGMLEELAVLRS
jgi:hypothetical protein